MLVELGPVPAVEVERWSRFARRVIVELRVAPGDLEGLANEDLLVRWSDLVDQWAAVASADRSPNETFRWSVELEVEMGEYLLHGLERCFHSSAVQARITRAEAETQRPFTMHVIEAFVDALAGEGVGHEQYAEVIRASLGGSLD